MFRYTVAFSGIMLISACSYNVTTDVNPATNIYSNYIDKIPGRFALYIDADEMIEDFKVSGYFCSAHTYPVDARSAFISSAENTIKNIIESIEIVPRPLDRITMQARAIKGMIVIEVADLDIDLKVIPGF